MTIIFRPMLLAAAVIVPLAWTSVAIADTAPATAPSPSADPGEQRVCKTVRPTGSRLGKRVCRTRAEWDQQERSSQAALDDAKNSGQAFQPRD